MRFFESKAEQRAYISAANKPEVAPPGWEYKFYDRAVPLEPSVRPELRVRVSTNYGTWEFTDPVDEHGNVVRAGLLGFAPDQLTLDRKTFGPDRVVEWWDGDAVVDYYVKTFKGWAMMDPEEFREHLPIVEVPDGWELSYTRREWQTKQVDVQEWERLRADRKP